MKRIYNTALIPIMFLMAAAIMASCVNEDTGDCPDGRVRLIVTPDYSVTRSNPADWYDIRCVHAYIFDADNKFVDCVRGGDFTGRDYVFDLELAAGTYHFIAWTNHGNIYKPNISMEECHLMYPASSELELAMKYTPGADITADIPDLHYGALPDAVVAEAADNEFKVVMRPNTYRINFTIKGLPETTDDYDFTITDNNSDYKFDNSIVPDKDDFTYRRTSRFEGAEIKASHKVLRLEHGRTPRFVLSNATTPEVLHTNDLVQMIKNAYEHNGQSVDFDAVHTFDITLQFDTDMGAVITVNNWSYSQQPSILG